MGGRKSLRSQPYRAAREVGNVEAAERGPASYGKRVVRRKVYRKSNGFLGRFLRERLLTRAGTKARERPVALSGSFRGQPRTRTGVRRALRHSGRVSVRSGQERCERESTEVTACVAEEEVNTIQGTHGT